MIEIIIDYMDSIFDLVFNLADDPRLQQWANDLILKVEARTESQMGDI